MIEIDQIAYNRNDLIGKGGFASVYGGTFRGGNGERIEVAVKRLIQGNLNTDEREKNALERLKGHPNIVYLFGTEEDNDFRYIALERCAASMDRIFLPDNDPRKYRGPLPPDLDVLLQLSKGLQYIHDKGFVHRGVAPGNVLISYPRKYDGTVVMKWADFGLSKPVSHRGTFTVSGHRGTPNWIAPEILAILGEDQNSSVKTQKGTVESDTWSFGCVIFAYLTQGKHPFAGGNGIHSNIMNGTPINLTALPIDHFAFNIIKGMIQNEPEERIKLTEIVEILHKDQEEENTISHWQDYISKMDKEGTKIGRTITYDRKKKIGEGGQGLVFSGTFRGYYEDPYPVAVKIILKVKVSTNYEREVNALKKLKGHPNIVFLFGIEEDDNYYYFAMELCKASMYDIFWKKYTGPLPLDLDVLLQLSEGLGYIHQNNIVHRDITPGNALVSLPKKGGMVVMKWTDFGWSKPVSRNGTYSMSRETRGTINWIAPEILESLEDEGPSKEIRGTVEGDTWSAGCLFLAYLTKGKHPFGDGFSINTNIKKDDPVNLKALPQDNFAFNIIKGMIQKDPMDRMKVTEVMNSLKEVKKTTSIVDANQMQELDVNAKRELEVGKLYCWKQWNLVLKDGQLFVWSEDVAIEGIPPQNHHESDGNMKIDTEPGRKDRDRKMLNLVGIKQGTPNKSIFNASFAAHEREWTVGSSELGDKLIIKEDVHDVRHQKWETVLFDGASFYSTFHVIEDGDKTTVWMTDKAKDKMVDELLKLCSSSSQEEQDLDRIAALLRVGINPNCTNRYGQTPLLLSLANQEGESRLKTLGILLEGNQSRGEETLPKGVNMNVKDSQKRNAFQLLLDEKGGIEDCTTYQALENLVRGGIDVHLQDGLKRTALHLLCLNYKRDNIVDVIKLLIEYGADIESKDNNGKTALDYLEKDPNMAAYKENILEMINQNGKRKRQESPPQHSSIEKKEGRGT